MLPRTWIGRAVVIIRPSATKAMLACLRIDACWSRTHLLRGLGRLGLGNAGRVISSPAEVGELLGAAAEGGHYDWCVLNRRLEHNKRHVSNIDHLGSSTFRIQRGTKKKRYVLEPETIPTMPPKWDLRQAGKSPAMAVTHQLRNLVGGNQSNWGDKARGSRNAAESNVAPEWCRIPLRVGSVLGKLWMGDFNKTMARQKSDCLGRTGMP